MAPWYIKNWEEGKHIDLWSLNHLVFGIIISALFSLKSFSFERGIIISFFVLFIWELLEHFFNVYEHLPNKTWDIIAGLIGFCIGYYLIYFNPENKIIILIAAVFIFAILEVFGFLAFLKRKSNKG